MGQGVAGRLAGKMTQFAVRPDFRICALSAVFAAFAMNSACFLPILRLNSRTLPAAQDRGGKRPPQA